MVNGQWAYAFIFNFPRQLQRSDAAAAQQLMRINELLICVRAAVAPKSMQLNSIC